MWRCINKSCTGYITTNINQKLIRQTIHDCRPKITETKLIKNQLSDEAIASDQPIPEIYKKTIVDLKNKGLDIVCELPNFNSVKSTMYRDRNKAHGVDRLFTNSPGDVQVSTYLPTLY